MPRWRRALRWVGLGLLGIVSLVLVVTAALLGYVSTRPGSEKVRQFLVAQVNQSVKGSIEVERLHLSPTHFVLENLRLKDPEGSEVAVVERVEVWLRLSPLLRKTVELSKVRIDKPHVTLESDEEGLNLARAIEPRNPKPSEQKTESSSFLGFTLVQFVLEEGAVSFQSGTTSISFTEMSMDASVDVLEGGKTADVRTSLHSRVEGLKPAVHLRGALARKGDDVQADFKADAGAAHAQFRSELNLESLVAKTLTLDISGINVEELVEEGLRSNLSLHAKASGGGKSLETMNAKLEVSMPQSPMGNQTLGPTELSANVVNGIWELQRLNVLLPGVEFRASGKGTQEKLSLNGELQAQSLARLSSVLGPLGISLMGSGNVRFAVEGPVKSPSVRMNGFFSRLQWQDNRLEAAGIILNVPSLKHPLDSQLTMNASSIVLGERTFESPRFTYRSEAGRVVTDLNIQGAYALALHAEGASDPGRESVRVERLALKFPEAEWSLASPATVLLGQERVGVENLLLQSGAQQLKVSGTKRGNLLLATVDAKSVDLTRLPHSWLPSDANPEGLLNADIQLKGTSSSPDVRAHLDLSNGCWKKLRRLSLQADATYRRDRARGKIAVTTPAGEALVEFDTPIRRLRMGTSVPVRIEGRVEKLSLADIQPLLDGDKSMEGTVTSDFSLTGTTQAPVLSLSVQGSAVRYDQLPPTDFVVTLEGTGQTPLHMTAEATTLERKISVNLQTHFTLARMLRRPPTLEQWLRAPFQLHVNVDRVPLPLPYIANQSAKLVLGNLSAQVSLKGTPLVPVGTVEARVEGLTSGKAAPVDIHFTMKAQESSTDASLRAFAPSTQQSLANLNLRVQGPLSKFRDPRAAMRIPISIEGEVGPIQLQELQRLAGLDADIFGRPRPQFQGTLESKLSVHGPIIAPRARLDTQLKALGTKSVSERANVRAVYVYEDARHSVDVGVENPQGGAFRVHGEVPLAMSALLSDKPIARQKVPLTGTVDAKEFELSFLSGLTEKIQHLSGLLNAQAKIDGTLVAPRVEGSLEWNQGAVSLAGNGAFKDIHILLRGNNDKLVLEKAEAHGGKGWAKLQATLNRVRQGWEVQSESIIQDLPIISDDQLVATLSMKAKARGSGNTSRFSLPAVSISEAHVQLPEVRKRDLQLLDAPQNVVFLRNGTPIKKQPEQDAASGTGGSGEEEKPSSFSVSAKIDAPRNLWVKGKDVTVELGLGDEFRLESGQTTELFGKVKVLRGTVEVFGRRFDLERGSNVTFTGPMLAPTLDVDAKHKNEREQVVVNLAIDGTPPNVTLSPTSEPPLSETEIYTLLATGRRNLRPGSGQSTSGSNVASSFLGSLAANQLKETLVGHLPLDVLSIEAGDQGIQGTRVEAGTYVNQRLYVGVTGQVGANPMQGENSNAVRLEYQLGKKWSLELDYGDAKAGGADLLWKNEF